MAISIVIYNQVNKTHWDRFISRSKNGVFLFYRDYMEYHADRFEDFSLLIYDNGNLIGVLPANLQDNKVISHGGLTFGGIITDSHMRTAKMLEIFMTLKGYFLDRCIHCLIYKAVPHIYWDIPAEEDLYALHYVGAKLYRRDVSSSITISSKLGFSKGRKWLIGRAKKKGLLVKQVNDFNTFMAIEEENLMQKHGIKPVHTAAELQLLSDKFPDNIKLFSSYIDHVMVGGVVIYESRQVAHAQYIAATEAGRAMGAIDIIISYLINEYYAEKKYFDFGISTEDDGRYLNVGLIENKEGYGARAVVYDFYEWTLS